MMDSCCVIFFLFAVFIAAIVPIWIAKLREISKPEKRSPYAPLRPPSDLDKRALRTLGCSDEEIAKIEEMKKLKKEQNPDRDLSRALAALETKKPPALPRLQPARPASIVPPPPSQPEAAVGSEEILPPPAFPKPPEPTFESVEPIVLQECAVCGKKIDPLAPPARWQNYVVCEGCYKKLA